MKGGKASITGQFNATLYFYSRLTVLGDITATGSQPGCSGADVPSSNAINLNFFPKGPDVWLALGFHIGGYARWTSYLKSEWNMGT